MCSVRFVISTYYRKEVERQLKTAQQLGHLRQVKYLLAILAVVDGQSFAQIALILRVHEKTVAAWVRVFCCYGITGAPRQKSRGRPPTLTPTQKAALATLIERGAGQGRVQRRLLAFADDPASDLRPLWRLLQRLLHRPATEEPGL
jgi:transposase